MNFLCFHNLNVLGGGFFFQYEETPSASSTYGSRKVVYCLKKALGGTPYNELCGEALPEGVPFLGWRYIKG